METVFIETHCPSCGNSGLTSWDPNPTASIDRYLDMLRGRCPDCGASGRTAKPINGTPEDPELAEAFDDFRAFSGDLQRRPPAAAGRNDPCPCGSGRKYKRCCGAAA